MPILSCHDTLIPDEERQYLRVAAEALGIPADFLAADGYALFDGWDRANFRSPEPTDEPFVQVCTDQLRRAASHTRVLLSGDGGDEILRSSCALNLVGRMPLRELAAAVARSLAVHHLRPGVGLRSRLRKRFMTASPVPSMPAWLTPAFTDRLDLRARWTRDHLDEPADRHALRAEAHQRLTAVCGPWCFEALDPGVTGVAVEARYPFLDLRVIDYLLAIPPVPWCTDKEILRLAMRGALPDVIRLRKKSPLAGDPLRARLNAPDAGWLDRFDPAPELAQFVDRPLIPRLAGGSTDTDPWLHIRPLCLNYWLTGVRRGTPVEKEVCA